MVTKRINLGGVLVQLGQGTATVHALDHDELVMVEGPWTASSISGVVADLADACEAQGLAYTASTLRGHLYELDFS